MFKFFPQPLNCLRSIVAVWTFVSMGWFNFEFFYLKIHLSATRRCPCAIFWLLSGVLAYFLFLWGELHNNAIIVAVSIETLLLLLLYVVGVCTSKQMRMLCLCPESSSFFPQMRELQMKKTCWVIHLLPFWHALFSEIYCIMYWVRISVCC